MNIFATRSSFPLRKSNTGTMTAIFVGSGTKKKSFNQISDQLNSQLIFWPFINPPYKTSTQHQNISPFGGRHNYHHHRQLSVKTFSVYCIKRSWDKKMVFKFTMALATLWFEKKNGHPLFKPSQTNLRLLSNFYLVALLCEVSAARGLAPHDRSFRHFKPTHALGLLFGQTTQTTRPWPYLSHIAARWIIVRAKFRPRAGSSEAVAQSGHELAPRRRAGTPQTRPHVQPYSPRGNLL